MSGATGYTPTLRSCRAFCWIAVGLVTTFSGRLGVIAVTRMLRVMVARSLSNVWKLCTGKPSGVCPVVCFLIADGERCAFATTLLRCA